MRALTAMFLTLIAAVFGYFLSIYVSTWDALVSITIIAMGGCIIYTINKNFEQLRSDIKQSKKENSVENNTNNE